MTREEQFRLYENAVKAEQKEMEENFERYKKALKKEKPCVERKTVYLDHEIVERLNKESRKIKDIIFDVLKEWQMGLRGELEHSGHNRRAYFRLRKLPFKRRRSQGQQDRRTVRHVDTKDHQYSS